MKKIIIAISVSIFFSLSLFFGINYQDFGKAESPSVAGDFFVNISEVEVCKDGYSKSARNVPDSLKQEIYKEWKIKDVKNYVIDHKINITLGGTNSKNNLWPQEKIEARKKDLVELSLWRQVCNDIINLETARGRILKWKDWYPVYVKKDWYLVYVNKNLGTISEDCEDDCY